MWWMWWTLRQLGSKDPKKRTSAANKLGASADPRAVEPLIAALDDCESSVRRVAITALGKIRDPRATEPLLGFSNFSAGNYEIEKAVIRALGELRDLRAAEAILDGRFRWLLKGRNPRHNIDLAVEAVRALGKIGGPRATQALVETLWDKDVEVREAAASALALLGWQPADDTHRALLAIAQHRWNDVARYGSAAAGPLVTLVNWSDNPFFLHAAWEALERIGPPAVEPIGEFLVRIKSDADWPNNKVCCRLVETLREIGDPTAVRPLLAAVQNAFLATTAGAALRQLLTKSGSKVAAEDLRAIVHDLPDVVHTGYFDEDEGHIWNIMECSGLKRLAQKELGRRGDKNEWAQWVTKVLEINEIVREMEPLTTALKHEQEDVREAAAWSLGEIGRPDAAEPLAVALRDVSKDVRHAAAEALVRVGPPALEALTSALKDPYKRVRTTAVWLLARIGDARAVEPLVHALRDSSKDVREAAAQALERLGGARAKEALAEYRSQNQKAVEHT